MNLLNTYTRIEKKLKKMPIWFHILLVLAIIFILVGIYKEFETPKEGFTDQKDGYVVKKGFNLYDDFYVNVYDQLFYRDIVSQFQVGNVQNETDTNSNSNILLIGSGTGHVADLISRQDLKVTGIDQSKAMVKYAKEEYPNVKFKHINPMKAIAFQPNTFSHILIFNMNYYYYKDKRQLLQNIYSWLKPGGYFVVQLVNKNKFDPVVPAAKPFVMVNPQSYSKKRITTSSVVFNNFDYKADYQVYPNDFVQFREIFKDKGVGSKKVRENVHKLWVPQKKVVIDQIKEAGFIVESEIDLLLAQLEYQYLYIFKKPN